MQPQDIAFIQTSDRMPEQYDAVAPEGTIIGYLRLRHGFFEVEYPDCGGQVVYSALTKGIDCFINERERRKYLQVARKKLVDAFHQSKSRVLEKQ